MKKKVQITTILVLIVQWGSWASTNDTATRPQSLEEELQLLEVPGNRVPVGVPSEKLYAVQDRYVPLKFRHELMMGGAVNMTPSSYAVSRQLDLGYRFYLSNRWYVGLEGSYVFNELSQAGELLYERYQIVPDIAVAKYRMDVLGGYHLFYGKFRLTMDSVLYFDFYLALGGGLVNFRHGNEKAAVGDFGLVGWLGRSFTLRLGMKDYFVREVRQKDSGMVHHLLSYAEVGYLL